MKTIALFTVSLFAFFGLNAQDEKKSEIHVKIEKDGKVVKDTTYLVDEDADIKVASKILDMTFGDHKHHGERIMAFSSDNGELHEFHSKGGDMSAKHKLIMKEMHEGESGHVFVTTEEGEDGEMTVIVKKIKIDEDGEHSWTNKEKNVYIIKEGEEDGEIIEFHSKDGNMHAKHKVIMKEMQEGEEGNVHVTTEVGEDGETIVIVKKIKIGEDGELKHIHHNGEKPVWIEEDGAKVMIIDTEDGKQKKIKVITKKDMDSESEQIIKTEDGETIIIRTIKEGDNEYDVKVEVIVEEERQEGEKKEIKKKRRKK